MNLANEVRTLFKPILSEYGVVPDDFLAMVKPASDSKNGDYQANFAMALAKALKKNPKELAAELVAKIPPNDLLESAIVAGPGFINLKLKDSAIAERVQAIASDERLGVAKALEPKTFVIDLSGPNVAKPLHVGHLRSTVIGDALVRILRFLGHTVVGDNHLGDWGTQFGMLIYGYRNLLNEQNFQQDPVRELARLYIEVRKLGKLFNVIGIACFDWEGGMKRDENLGRHIAKVYTYFTKKLAEWDEEEVDTNIPNPIAELYRAETAKLHAGDAENLALWQQFMPHCLDMLKPIYERLDVKIDHALGESFYNPMLPGIVEDLLKKGIAIESNGAIVVPNAKGVVPSPEEMATEEPPALIRKRDGAFTYTTTDLATVKYRIETWQPDVLLYVVDARQALHFKTLFANAKKWGYDQVEFHHVAFGSILGKDKKPYRTRDGGTIELAELLDEAATRGLQKYEQSHAERKSHGHDLPDLNDETKRTIAETIGYGSVKYADLSGNRVSDYIFDFDKMLATDGNTATYMQYAYARCRAIFRKGEVDETAFRLVPPKVILGQPAERALAIQLLKFEEVLVEVSSKYEPHHIAGYLWDLAKAFSGFFENCPVLTATSEELKQSRLLLVDLTGRLIRQALALLGIRTVERM